MKTPRYPSSRVAEKIMVGAVFVMLLGFDWIVWSVFREREIGHARTSFNSDISEIVSNIEKRMAVHEQVLLGGGGLFEASTIVSRTSWRAYVESLKLAERFPGIQGVGFSLVVPAAQKDDHVATIRAEGFPNYDIRPPDPRAVYHSIIYLEPFASRNLRAFGYDMSTEATRRAAMEAARDTGQPVLSGKVTLVQETDKDVQAGVLLYLPIYKKDAPRRTPAEMREALHGYVYSPFRMNDLMAGILGKDIDTIRLEIFDGGWPQAETLLYDSLRGAEGESRFEPAYENSRRLQINGRAWLVRLSSLPAFERQARGQVSTLIALIGGLLTIMLTVLAWFLTISKANAIANIRQVIDDRTNELRASEDRLRSIIDTAVAGMVTIDEKGIVQSFNPAAERIFGYPASAVVGRNVNILVPDEIRASHDGFIRRYLETGEARIIGTGREVEGRRKDGSLFPMRLGIGEAHMATGRLFTGIISDLSKEKEAEAALHERQEQLVAARDQAEAANRAKSDFLAMMSHEIRTPIHGVMGAIGLVATTKDPAERDRWIGLAKRSADSLLTIINDILDFSKIEAGRIDLTPEPAQPRAVFQATAEFLAPLARDKGLAYEIEYGGDVDAWVSIDAGRLRQVLTNLIGNAIKFTPKGFVRARVETAAPTADGMTLRFVVADSGIGIPASERAKLFQEFSRLGRETRGEIEGTGLGLAISQRLVGLMGGQITVDSAEGVGSAFRIAIPVKFAEPPQVAEAEPTQAVAGRPLDILVVDDSKANCDIAKAYLESAGHRVAIAMNGTEALDAVTRRDFDIVVIDMVMPVMDGMEATRRIRKLDGAKSRIPIIGLTADVTRNRAKFAEAGVDRVLTKPIAGPALIAAVAQGVGATSPIPEHEKAKPAPAPEKGGIDWAAIADLRRKLGAPIANQLLSSFVAEMADRAEILRETARSGDMPELKKEAHRLAGSTGSYGLAEASTLARRLEVTASTGHREDSDALARDLLAALARDIGALRGELARKTP